MMKLCIVTPYVMKGDGQGRANYEIVWEAIRRGYSITLLARAIAPELEHHSQVNWISFPIKQLPTELIKGMAFSWQSARWLQRHRQNFDLIQTYGCVTNAPSDINTVQFVHNGWLNSPVHTSQQRQDFYGFYQGIYSRLNAYWEKQAFAQAKIIVAVSEKIKNELLEIGIPDERIRVILNGVDLEEFFPGEADRHQLGLPEGNPLAAFVGDIRTNRKNLDTVLDALVQVPQLHLVVLGKTEGSPYPQLASQLSLENRVHFLGFRRDVAQILRAVDLFVFPSRYEACTLALLEAMATGLPVITAPSTGGAEIVTPECGVVLPDSEDVESLAQALKMLANNPKQTEMSQAARAIAQNHSWVSKAKSYIDLFEEISQPC